MRTIFFTNVAACLGFSTMPVPPLSPPTPPPPPSLQLKLKICNNSEAKISKQRSENTSETYEAKNEMIGAENK